MTTERQIEPYPLKLNGENMYVVRNPFDREAYLRDHPAMPPEALGYVAVALFREKNYADYIAIATVDDVGETEHWTPVYEQYELVDWFAGFTIEEGTQRWTNLHTIHRKVGRFVAAYGWGPDVVVEQYPSENEMDNYITFVVDKDVDHGGELVLPGDEN